jgi:hypothetical protein
VSRVSLNFDRTKSRVHRKKKKAVGGVSRDRNAEVVRMMMKRNLIDLQTTDREKLFPDVCRHIVFPMYKQRHLVLPKFIDGPEGLGAPMGTPKLLSFPVRPPKKNMFRPSYQQISSINGLGLRRACSVTNIAICQLTHQQNSFISLRLSQPSHKHRNLPSPKFKYTILRAACINLPSL